MSQRAEELLKRLAACEPEGRPRSVEGYGETALQAVQALRAKLETKES